MCSQWPFPSIPDAERSSQGCLDVPLESQERLCLSTHTDTEALPAASLWLSTWLCSPCSYTGQAPGSQPTPLSLNGNASDLTAGCIHRVVYTVNIATGVEDSTRDKINPESWPWDLSYHVGDRGRGQWVPLPQCVKPNMSNPWAQFHSAKERGRRKIEPVFPFGPYESSYFCPNVVRLEEFPPYELISLNSLWVLLYFLSEQQKDAHVAQLQHLKDP